MEQDILQLAANWPGKSAAPETGIEHPALYHMLDVAAVAERLIAPFDMGATNKALLVLLTALHDLGKISDDFRAMLRGEVYNKGLRHWEVTELLLQLHDAELEAMIGGSEDARKLLYAAIAGHHGRPPKKTLQELKRAKRKVSGQARAASLQVIQALGQFWPDASLNGIDDMRATQLSWWLPGLVAAADWIGSNTDWFPATAPDLQPAAYLEQSRRRAKKAVATAGLESPKPVAHPLFDFVPRPMQTACQTIDLPEGPMLAILEDETGAGKTEAALMLAQRMLCAGKGRGLFFALPTMATANAMFPRASAAVRRLFDAPPSLSLAHGRAALSETYRDLIAQASRPTDEPVCTEWLADNRRRALLANIGVGTIDQALLGILPTKHATLRLYGLSSKILIVDEVHELGDPYMGAELVRLLEAHRMNGGSAILLTATLPLDQRRALLASYGAEDQGDPRYPALTLSDGTAARDFPQETGARGPVAVERLGHAAEAIALLKQSAEAGAACLWVRNAVDDAVAAVEALRAEGVPADLLHARFALGDRLAHEAQALARFGKGREARPGRVLVATQVVESSLDLDFDVMVSDLAPMAALVQRAGRLWRHMAERPSQTRPVPAPVLHVISPDPAQVADARWLNRVLDKGARVYGHDLQWRTARALFAAGRIEAPSGLRDLIEAAHSPEAPPVPEPLIEAELERIGEGFAAATQAKHNMIALEEGYRLSGGGLDDTVYPTRLGEEQRLLVLARRAAGALEFWVGEAQRSEVQVAARRLDGLDLPAQDSPEITALTKEWPTWKREAVTVCLVREDGQICPGLRYDRARGLIFG
ncbi:MAG: CRISPR-associated helicase Cas3' [Mangrovicoccus sp.]